MRVLVVEDDAAVAAGIVDGLEHAAMEVRHVSTGAAALAEVGSGGGGFAPDLILLDLGLPDMDGTDVCRGIRSTSTVPIIVVSARDEEIDRVLALEMGADDYVVKPFGMRELVARIRAVTRRTAATGADPVDEERRHGPLTIDERTRRVTLDGIELHLTAKEFGLLAYLAADSGAVLRRGDILRDVWDTDWFGTTKTLDAHVAAIRRKLGDPAWIESVRGIGFRFQVPSGPA